MSELTLITLYLDDSISEEEFLFGTSCKSEYAYAIIALNNHLQNRGEYEDVFLTLNELKPRLQDQFDDILDR